MRLRGLTGWNWWQDKGRLRRSGICIVGTTRGQGEAKTRGTLRG